MAVSILHRITGAALALLGLPLLVWWLSALADGGDGYSTFTSVSSHWVGVIILIGLSWAFFMKALGGVRHLVMDTGRALELGVNKKSAVGTLIGSVVLTALLWIYIFGAAA
jgi:succinate dehydrogenase / fumarate reductase cytochrome b subunit